MCGIVGVVGSSTSEQRQKALSLLAHRGPDGEGQYSPPDDQVWLGHRRLAIIDPAAGVQPMTNEDSSVWIVFNGCLYNYQELATVLRSLGHRFRTYSDTEVLIHAYEQWGERCVERFNGMWAFAIWDNKTKTMFCSRDRIGVKPFYFTYEGNKFCFASEIKALLAFESASPSLNPDGLRQYLTFQFCLGANTLFKGVRRLEPGHNLTLRLGEVPKITGYWDLAFEVQDTLDEDTAVDKIRWLMEDAVRLRLRSGVPLGGHLSGGLDSSTISTLASIILGRAIPVKTFTGYFPEGSGYDETPYAKAVARNIGAEYNDVAITADDFLRDFEKICWHMDEPAAGPGVFPQYCVSRLAAGQVKVVLGGQGGDELFLGYARYLVMYLEECLKGAIRDTSDRGTFVATLSSITQNLRLLQSYEPMLKAFWSNGLFEPSDRRYLSLMDRLNTYHEVLSPDLKLDHSRTHEEFREIFERPQAPSLINRIQYFDLKTHLQALLHVEDRTSMAWGLESRVPLLDYRLYETVASIPPIVKFRNGRLKHLMLEVTKRLLPRQIHERKDKMGFPVPLVKWAQGPLRDYICDTLLSESSRQRGIFSVSGLEATIPKENAFGRATWGALCLEQCFRLFLDT